VLLGLQYWYQLLRTLFNFVDVDRRVLKLLQEPAVWVNDKPLSLSSTSSGHRPPQQPQQRPSVDQNNKVRPTSVSKAPRSDGDNFCHASIVVPTQKYQPDHNSSLDRSLGMLDTSLQSSFSLPFKKSRRFFRTSGSYDPMRPSWLEDLPDEVIVRIFGFLTKSSLATCARTCKKFRRITEDEYLWKRVDLGNCNLVFEPKVFGQMKCSILRLVIYSMDEHFFKQTLIDNRADEIPL